MSEHEALTGTATGRRKEFGSDICSNCGRDIDTTEWRPAATGRDSTGRYEVLVFCDHDCRDGWSNN